MEDNNLDISIEELDNKEASTFLSPSKTLLSPNKTVLTNKLIIFSKKTKRQWTQVWSRRAHVPSNPWKPQKPHTKKTLPLPHVFTRWWKEFPV